MSETRKEIRNKYIQQVLQAATSKSSTNKVFYKKNLNEAVNLCRVNNLLSEEILNLAIWGPQ